MYYRTIPGNQKLADIEQLIHDEEVGGSKFVENKVAALDGTICNLVKYVELGHGQRPRRAQLNLKSEPAPDGTKLEWDGVFLVDGAQSVIALYRPSGA